MRLLLATATRREMISALQPFSRPEELPYGMPVEWSVRQRPCLLLITGIGPINPAMHLAGTLARAEPVAGVLNLGIGGSFDLPGLPLLQLCSVQEEIWPEFGLWTDQGLNPRALKFPLGKSRGRSVWDRIELDPERAADEMGLKLPRAWPRVRSVSVAGVSGTMDRAFELRQRYGAELENMEGFALGWACLQAGVPFLECRSVSNLVGSRRAEDWDLRGALNMLGQALACLL
jgi:futalosine hydrolase